MPYKTEKWPPKRHFSRRHPEALAAAGVAAEWSGESKGRTALCQHTGKKECYDSIFGTIRDGNGFVRCAVRSTSGAFKSASTRPHRLKTQVIGPRGLSLNGAFDRQPSATVTKFFGRGVHGVKYGEP